MLTAQEEARILAKIRKDSYGITLEQMKQYFIKHQHAREIGDKKMMEKIEYHLTYINFHYECGLLATGQYDMIVFRAGYAAIGVRNGNSAAERIIGVAGRIAVGVCNRGHISCFVVAVPEQFPLCGWASIQSSAGLSHKRRPQT